MDDLLGGVLCACGTCCCHLLSNVSPQCLQQVLCFPLAPCSKCRGEHWENCLHCCCKACCECMRLWGQSCARSGSTLYYVDCGNCECGVSATVICGLIAAVFCICLGIICEITAYRFGDNQCKQPIDTHVVVQGIVLIGDAIVLLYVLYKYYIPRSIAFPLSNSTVFPRFHGLFARDRPLGLLLGVVSLGFWWTILGYYWLAGVECDPEDDFLLTMDSFAIAVEFILVLFCLGFVYVVLVIAACDEGSCRFGAVQTDCFLCCCLCCFTTPADFQQRHHQQAAAARRTYPFHRNTCLLFLMDILKMCGCIRPGYVSKSTIEAEFPRVNILTEAGNQDPVLQPDKSMVTGIVSSVQQDPPLPHIASVTPL